MRVRAMFYWAAWMAFAGNQNQENSNRCSATKQDIGEVHARDVARNLQCDGQDFAADQVEANFWRSRAIKKPKNLRDLLREPRVW
jgi:hypothetical protein